MVGWLSGFRAQTGRVAYWKNATFDGRLGEAAAPGGLGRYLSIAGRVAWVFAWRGSVTQPLICALTVPAPKNVTDLKRLCLNCSYSKSCLVKE